jgi:hypothetical protein
MLVYNNRCTIVTLHLKVLSGNNVAPLNLSFIPTNPKAINATPRQANNKLVVIM